jgi:hypothetical protein
MALIGKIRNNMWFVIILLALGLGGFVFMDISSVNSLGGGNQFNVGKVNGTEIDWVEFQKAQEALYSGSTVDVYDQRDFVWSYFVEEAIISAEAEQIGLNVGDAEMDELQFGTRLSPVVQRNFTDPQTHAGATISKSMGVPAKRGGKGKTGGETRRLGEKEYLYPNLDGRRPAKGSEYKCGFPVCHDPL